ncbi:hypothetical protein Y032_0197g1553 [Ancylostoma ceylanicum]|uniref:Uncharacterized protein n=3 Tax=Ancylostoma ceylanicum TaxID=53326 RepID=A0A016SP24_9BILA|nr:hypothetical protein Y032_0197g1553 [Ancylostoma ceylanicum]
MTAEKLWCNINAHFTQVMHDFLFELLSMDASLRLPRIIGVSTEKKALVNAHITIVTALMVFTDIIAISIVLIMAIGNRNKLTYSLPGHFVDERKFYAVLGPFWMYLGAISLHITVAVNMCFLQVLNSFISFLDEKMTPTGSSLDLKQAETKMKSEEITRN